MHRNESVASNRTSGFMKMTIFAPALSILLVAPLGAQTGGGKETKKLQSKVESVHDDVGSTKEQIQETMDLYNAIIEEKAKKPQSTFKKLGKSVEDCDKSAKGVGKSVESLRKDLDKFFASWEKEISVYTTEAMQERSRKSLDEVKGKFDRFETSLKEASELYKPFIASLRDHVAFLGRDLSADTIADFQDEAAKLNETASLLYDKINEALNDTRDEEVEAAVATDEMGDEETDEEGTGDETEMADDPGDEAGEMDEESDMDDEGSE